MSDWYGANWGPSGPGGEQVPPQAWAFGDQGPLDPTAHQAFDVADAQWRMAHERGLAAEAAAANAAATPPTPAPQAGGPPASAARTPGYPRLPAPTQPGGWPDSLSPYTVNTPTGVRPVQPEHRPVPAHFSHEDIYAEQVDRPRALRALGVMAGVFAVGITATMLVGGADSASRHGNGVPYREGVSAGSAASAPEGYACSVVGVDELSPYTGSVTLSAATGGLPVRIGGMVRADTAPPGATTVTFDSSGQHGKTLTVTVADVPCAGAFNLGAVGRGDESFRAS